MRNKIDLSIVIVSWNVRDLLRQCLQSIVEQATRSTDQPTLWRLETGHTFQVIVIDSASSDGSAAMAQAEFPGVRVYASKSNLGYAGGNNLGLSHSRGRYILLLNPDTRVLHGALSVLIDYMDDHPTVGVSGPQLLYPDGSIQSSRRRFPTLGTALIESTFLQQWFPHHHLLNRYYVLDQPNDTICNVDWVIGACILVRKAVVDQVGALDDGYFMYSEELDWQKRIRAAGWQVSYVPAAQVIHYEGKSSEQVMAFRHIRFQKSKIRYFAKHHGPASGALLRAWLLFHYAYLWSIEMLKWLVGHKRDLRRERMRVYAQTLQSGLKP